MQNALESVKILLVWIGQSQCGLNLVKFSAVLLVDVWPLVIYSCLQYSLHSCVCLVYVACWLRACVTRMASISAFALLGYAAVWSIRMDQVALTGEVEVYVRCCVSMVLRI